MTGWKDRIVGLERVQAKDLVPNPRNFRKHPEGQKTALTEVLEKIGIADALLAYPGADGKLHLVDGHLRQGLDPEAYLPVLVTDLTEAEAQQLLLVFDPLTQMAETDHIALQDLVGALEGYVSAGELTPLYYQDDVLAGLIAQLGTDGEKKTYNLDSTTLPPADEHAVYRTQFGDLWALGPHRLKCGDSTSAEDTQSLLGDVRPILLVTSPPYWVGKSYENEGSWEEIQAFMAACTDRWTAHMDPYGRIVVNTGTCQAGRWFKGVAQMRLLLDDWQRALEHRGWPMRYVRCWPKRGQLGMIGPQMDVIDVHWEFLGYFYHPPAKPFRGQEKVGEAWATDGVWDGIAGDAGAGGHHEAAFPLVIPERNIKVHSRVGEAVWEPFNGSGTTLLACQLLDRVCYSMEFLPRHCDTTLARWEELTGETATLLYRKDPA
jgi:DNA modification methylase